MQKLMSPNTIIERITGISHKAPAAADEFVKYYVFRHNNPEYTEYQSSFNAAETKLQQINSNLFLVKNTLDKNSATLNASLTTIEDKIDEERRINRALTRQIGASEQNENGSAEMIHDYTLLYNAQYNRNFMILAGCVGLIAGYNKIFSQPTT